MPHHEHIKVAGRIGDVFFHRFVIERDDGVRLLADIGPKGTEAFRLETGVAIVAEGEMKPSELKVDRIARQGGKAIDVSHGKPHHPDPHHHEPHAEPGEAKRAVERAGFTAIGEPRRKPKHFEVLARKGQQLVECHVELDGHIRKDKPVDPRDHKWAAELQAVAT